MSEKKIKTKNTNLETIEEKEVIAEVKEEIVSEQPKKQNQMFHQLEEDRIKLEATEMIKKEEAKKRDLENIEKVKKENNHKPKLVCPFCQHIQYSTNSKDPTSSWCEICGRCYSAIWA